nr:DUF692 domain-containing protein [Micromonospora sp. DSM 115978]
MLGVGIGWRPEIDLTVERLPGVDFVEVIAENVRPRRLPESLRLLRGRGVTVVPHGVGLGLGGAEPPDRRRLAHLAECAGALGSPLVSEHVAMVRAGRVEAGHLLPVPRTRDSLDVLVDNVRIAQDALPVPLALENVAALFRWPDDELAEAEFLTGLVERTGVRLLVDVANLHTNGVNQGVDPLATLAGLPLGALAYVHVAGGLSRDGIWHDTHTRAPSEDIYRLLGRLRALAQPPGVLLEWDGDYPADRVLDGALARIREIVGPRLAVDGPAAGPPTRPAAGGPAAGGPAGSGTPTAPGRPRRWPPRRRPEVRHRPARVRLAQRYAPLVDALVRGAPAPAGFDPDRIRLQAERLAVRHRRHRH